MTYHQTIIVGNVGNDPELRDVGGSKVCNLSVAVSETWNDRNTNEKREKTTWYRVAVWGGQAEVVKQYVRKGRQVMVIGTVSARGYTNNNGEAAASLELRARDVRFLGNRGDDNYSSGGSSGGSSSSSNNNNNYDNDHSPPPKDMDDIPF
ncbi:MAG: single-stranded DNA-binding protein [Aggregatilineales bacterium]